MIPYIDLRNLTLIKLIIETQVMQSVSFFCTQPLRITPEGNILQKLIID